MAVKRGSSRSDAISGGRSADIIYGLGGNDVLKGLAGNDRIYGGDGNDKLYGGAGNDLLDGGPGDFDQLYGDSGNDKINGGSGRFDALYGGSGNDVLNPGAGGTSQLLGGPGSDTYFVFNYQDAVLEYPGEGRDTVKAYYDYQVVGSIETVELMGAARLSAYGNSDENILIGNVAGNHLDGGGGRDTLFGMNGNDTLFGGFGNDALFGGRGDDRIDGAWGQDVISGGRGADRLTGGSSDASSVIDFFLFDSGDMDGTVDVITDFRQGVDWVTLDLSDFSGPMPAFVVNDTVQSILSAENFRLGIAIDSNDFILFDSTNATLSLDTDGSGPTAAVPFVRFENGFVDSAIQFDILLSSGSPFDLV